MHIHKDQRGIAHLLPLLIIGVLFIVGGSFYLFMKKSQDTQLRAGNAPTITTKDTLPDSLEGIKPLEEITQAAIKDMEGVEVSQIELGQERGALVYKVVRTDGKVVVINAKTGAVVRQTQSAEKSDHAALPAGFSPQISLLKARELAVAERPGSKVGKIHLSMEQNALTYSVRFTDKSRVDLSAMDGMVLRVKDADGKVVKKAKAGTPAAAAHAADGHTDDGHSDGNGDDSTSAQPAPAVPSTGITRDQAIAIANERLPEKTIKDVKDELEYGVPLFSVRYTDDSRVDVRRSDGAIVRVETR